MRDEQAQNEQAQNEQAQNEQAQNEQAQNEQAQNEQAQNSPTVLVPEHARWTENETSQVVVMNTRTGDFYGLAQTGSLVWKAIAESGSIDSACEVLTASFEVGPEVARADVLGLVEGLLAADLLVGRGDADV